MFFEGDRILATRRIAARLSRNRPTSARFRGDLQVVERLRHHFQPLHEHDSKQIGDLAKKLKVKPVEMKRVACDASRMSSGYLLPGDRDAGARHFRSGQRPEKEDQGEPRDHGSAGRLRKELELQAEIVHRVAKEVSKEKDVKLNYLVGTMIEVPRGALTADEIAETASSSALARTT